MLSQNGTTLRDEAGKIRYAPVIAFQSTEVRQRFTNAIIAALRLAHPEVFAEAAP
jgi:hypothetical protein